MAKDPVKQTRERIKALNELRKAEQGLTQDQRKTLDGLRAQLAALTNMDKRQQKLAKSGGTYASLSKQWADNAMQGAKGEQQLANIQKGQLDLYQKAIAGQLTSAAIGQQKIDLESEMSDISSRYFGSNEAHGKELNAQIESMIEQLSIIEDINVAEQDRNDKAAELQKNMGPFRKAWEDVKAKVGDFAKKIFSVKGMLGLMGAGLVGVGMKVFKSFTGMWKSAFGMQKELGVGVGHGMDLALATQEQAAGAFMYGENIEDVQARTTELVKQWGNVGDVSMEAIGLANELERSYGLSTGSAAQLTSMMESTSSASKEVLMAGIAEEMQSAQDAGLPIGLIMEEVAGNTDFFAGHMKDGGKNIIKAAKFAKKLGMSMDTIAGAADSLLDVESSINAEMEASVLLGRSVNMDEARRLALAGDLEGMQRAIMDQVGSEADFAAMNVVQRKALAEAAGVSLTDLSKMVSAQEKLNNMSQAELDDNEAKAAHSKKIKALWEGVVGIFKRLFSKFIKPITKMLMRILGISADLGSGDGFGDVETILADINAWIDPLADKFETWINGIGTTTKDVGGIWTSVKGTIADVGEVVKTVSAFVYEHKELIAGLAVIWALNKTGVLAFVRGAINALVQLATQFLVTWAAKKMMADQPMDSKKTSTGGNPVKMIAGAAAMVIMAAALWIMAKAMQEFSTGVSWPGVAMGLISLAALTVAAVVLGSVSAMVIVGAAAMVILAAAFYIMGAASKLFAEALVILTPVLTAFFDGIALVIGAIAGAFVAMLNGIADTFERLAAIGGGQLLGTAGGIAAIALALAGFGGGSLLGGIGAGIGAFFGGDPVKKFERFAAMAPGLEITAKSMEILSKGMKTITSMDLDDVIDPLAEFTSALMGGGMMLLGGIFGGGPMEKIEKFSELGPGLKITGDGLKNVADSIKFIDGPGLIKAAVGIDKLGKALFSFGMGGAVAGIGSAIGSLFGQDPIKKFERFGELGPELKVTAVSMKMLSKSMADLIKFIDGPELIKAAVGIDKLGKALFSFGMGGAVSSIGSAIGSLFGQDPIKKFEKFGELGPELKVTAVSMQMLSKSMRELQSINLGKLVDPTLKLAGAFQDLASAAREVNRATVASMALGVVSTIGSAIQGTVTNIASLIGIVEQKKDSKIVADPVTAAKLDKVILLLSAMPTDDKQVTRSRKEISAIEEAFANK